MAQDVAVLEELRAIRKLLEKLTVQLDLTAPVNQYGEGLSDAIQNSIERGLRSINSTDFGRS